MLLSRPVVCTNFQGLEKNTFFQLAESFKATVGAWYPDTKFKFSTYYNLVPRYVQCTRAWQVRKAGRQILVL